MACDSPILYTLTLERGDTMSSTRRRPRASVLALGAFSLIGCAAPQSTDREPAERPNVLFISIDDLNDWITPLGGHPQSRTPNLERLAREGVTFTRNYTASPACNPSRAALLTGLHPYTTGMYSNYQYWRKVLPDAETLPGYFKDHGYWTGGAGKIFHNTEPHPPSWNEYFPSKEDTMPDYFRPKPGETVNMPRFENMSGIFDWSPIDIPDEETGDYSSVSWVIEQLQREHDRPFFLAAGIYRPHTPFYVPREYFDLFPLESIELPKTLEGDLDDVSERGREIARRAGDYHSHVVEAGQWKQAVQGYLASIAFADALVGRLLEALEQSPYASNTIVVLWSDHGWQLGEKKHWRKFALWDNVARTVLMMHVPSGTPGLPQGSKAGSRVERVTSLVDLFPTLVELAGLPAKDGLDGRSLAPLVADPQAVWDHPAITTYDIFEFSIRTEDWRYIRYIDDSEELYDHRNDPEEWTNLADDPEHAEIKARLAGHIPRNPAPFVETSFQLMPHHVRPFRSKEDYEASRQD